MTEIKRYDVNKANMIGLVRFDEKESGRWVKYEDLAAIQEQLSQFSMSAGHADQRKAESVAVRVALGFTADADDVAPCDLVDAIAALQEQVRALSAENIALKSAFNPEGISEEAVEAFTETAILDHDWDETGSWSWVDNDTDVIRAVLAAIKPETPATDAALREIRAQGIEGFANHCRERALVKSYMFWTDAGTSAEEFAAAIRAGEQP